MSHCSVLIVDDDPMIREVVETILEDEGYPVRTAPDVDDALQSLEQDPAALILLDLHLPGQDGEDLVRQLRALPSPPRIAVMSGASDAESLAESLAVDGCLSKPFGMDELLGEVARICPER